MNDLLKELGEGSNLWLKLLAVFASVFIIVAFLPKEAKFQYEFQKGTPWLHEDLLAPFDFAIYKTEERLQEEEIQIQEKNIPYFELNEKISKAEIQGFETDLVLIWDSIEVSEADGLPALSQNYDLEFGAELLRSIYSNGILESHESIDQLAADEPIYIKRAGAVSIIELGEVYTINSALEKLDKELKGRQSDYAGVLGQTLKNHLRANLLFDETSTTEKLTDQLKNISLSFGKISQNQKVIGKGELVNEELYQKLNSLKKEYELRSTGGKDRWILIMGQVLIVAISLLALLLFLSTFSKDIINENNRFSFTLLVFTLTVIMGSLPQYFESLNIYLLPFCILPILLRTFFDIRLAIFIHLLAMILIGFVAPNGFEFVFVQSIAGLMGMFSLVSLRKRSQLLTTALVIFSSYTLTYIGLSVIHEAALDRIQWVNLQWFGISAVLTLLVYPLIYLFEKAFSFLSDVTLMEISDTNSVLLRELNTKSPGTFQHSLQVANLAEAGILEIGGDPLLIRTGALYHDIGKMQNPAFFIENQTPGFNPHDDLSYKESAKIIINHVIDGLALGKKYNLPDRILDFIRTHHGTSTTRYFYTMYKNENPDEEIDPRDFQYPGPIPFSRETAVLMMADSVEAAARSMKEYTPESIEKSVSGIIDAQTAEGQFEDADITFKDLSTLKRIFIKMLKTIYHVRIAYPEEQKK